MNYIEEMMKTVGIEKGKPIYDHGICIAMDKNNYKDFTTEKQIEIIKLIGKAPGLHYLGRGTWALSESSGEKNIKIKNGNFIQALARLTIELMYAGKLDKNKVKEILEQ